MNGAPSPGNGAKAISTRGFFRPVPGLRYVYPIPTADAVGYVLSPSGLGDCGLKRLFLGWRGAGGIPENEFRVDHNLGFGYGGFPGFRHQRFANDVTDLFPRNVNRGE